MPVAFVVNIHDGDGDANDIDDDGRTSLVIFSFFLQLL